MLQDLNAAGKIFCMKKIILVIALFVLFGGLYWFFALRLDYTKIIFVLPSSKHVSSPYYYKKDGDFFLADDLRQGLEKLGYSVSYRFRENYDNLKLGNAGNVLYFKGYYNFKHLPENQKDGRKRVLYLYYMEGLHQEILREVDVVACASEKFTESVLKSLKVEATFVPQFTNPLRFRPTEKDENKAYSVLFVGSNHSRNGRKVVDYAIKSQADLAVFGKFWEKYLEPKYLKGGYIDNDELYQYYANAIIVLNDHREDMSYFGFVSNRIYDVTASGGFILTDYLPEIEQIYGDSVATYKNFDEFQEKLSYYLGHPEERAIMVENARKITLERFTNDKAAENFDKIFKNIKK